MAETLATSCGRRRRAVATLAVAGCTGPQHRQRRAARRRTRSLNVYLYQEPAGIFGPLAPGQRSGQPGDVVHQRGPARRRPELQAAAAAGRELRRCRPTPRPSPSTCARASSGATARRSRRRTCCSPTTLLAEPEDHERHGRQLRGRAGRQRLRRRQGPDDLRLQRARRQHLRHQGGQARTIGLLALIGIAYIMPEHVLGKARSATAWRKDAFFRTPTVSIGPVQVRRVQDQPVRARHGEPELPRRRRRSRTSTSSR